MATLQRLVRTVASCRREPSHLALRFLCSGSCDVNYANQKAYARRGHTDSQDWSDAEGHDDLSSMAKDLNMDKLQLAEKVLQHSINESEGKMGSGIGGTPLCVSPCSNWSGMEGFACSNAGLISCRSCGLVHYCSVECKEEHSPEHESSCKVLANQTTCVDKKPVDVLSRRALLRAESDFLWGNVPAYGILGQTFEAKDISRHISVCFCASGDLRNVIETVCQLPNNWKGQLTIYINDHNPIIMARNLLMLKLLQVYAYGALDGIIALWYSAAMTHAQSVVIDGVVLDMLKSTVGQGKDKELYSFDFKSGSGSTLSMDDGIRVWPILARMSACRYSLQEALRFRAGKIRSGLKFDCKTACLRPSHRVVWESFRKSGLLLPFGACHAHHCAPNKFLLHPSGEWVLHSDANPFSGWDITSIMAAGSARGLPESDLFGCLFFHLRSKLDNFLHKLENCTVHFKLSCKDASQLAKDMAAQSIRLYCVDTSNLADLNYGGLSRVLYDWEPLLDRASDFAATLITYFMNWVYTERALSSHEHITLSKLTWKDVNSVIALMNTKNPSCAEKLRQLLELGNSCGNLSILDYFHDFRPAFEEYLQAKHAEIDAERVGLKRRKKHQIVSRRLSMDVEDGDGIPGRTASYYQCYYDCMVGDLTFTEQFVEWGLS